MMRPIERSDPDTLLKQHFDREAGTIADGGFSRQVRRRIDRRRRVRAACTAGAWIGSIALLTTVPGVDRLSEAWQLGAQLAATGPNSWAPLLVLLLVAGMATAAVGGQALDLD